MYKQNPFSTFQGFYQPNFFVPPPPTVWPKTDQEYVKTFESQQRTLRTKPLNQDTKNLLFDMVKESEVLSKEMISLQEKIETISDSEWLSKMNTLKERTSQINDKMADFQGPFLDKFTKRVNKINARRAHRKRVRTEWKREKEERAKQREERSRKIDENLQKIKDEHDNKKQDAESKAQADKVLREVLHKKNDAKKCIAKLDALVKLRRARQNTARGRGEDVSERDAESFNGNIEKLKSLWSQKLTTYEKEESAFRSKLEEDNVQSTLIEETQKKMVDNLEEWKMWLFEGMEPQRDFGGDVGRFVRVRSQWDHYISEEGTSLPVGWAH